MNTREDVKIEVTNLDEVKLHLRSELGLVIKELKSAILKSKPEQIDIPDSVEINNLDKIHTLLGSILERVSSLEPKVEPVINVTTPDVYIPEIKVPEIRQADVYVNPTPVNVKASDVIIDLQSLLEALEPLKLLSDKPSSPISVRMSDGKKFVEAIQAVAKGQDKMLQVFSNNTGLSKDEFIDAVRMTGQVGVANTLVSGFKSLTDASTAVQVLSTSTDIMWIDVTANGGIVVCGDSSAVATSGSEVGTVLYPGNPPTRFEINNINKLYAAGASGTRLTYTYFVR